GEIKADHGHEVGPGDGVDEGGQAGGRDDQSEPGVAHIVELVVRATVAPGDGGFGGWRGGQEVDPLDPLDDGLVEGGPLAGSVAVGRVDRLEQVGDGPVIELPLVAG